MNDIIVIQEEIKSIIFDVYVIGYSNQGESILFFLKINDKVEYSGIIDSHKKNNINISQNILEMVIPKKKLDFFCWTHPHEDHSGGLSDIMKKFVDTKTIFTFPYPLQGLPTTFTGEVAKALDTMRSENQVQGRSFENRWNYHPVINDNFLNITRTFKKLKDDHLKINIHNLGPYPKVVGIGNTNYNDYSTMISMSLIDCDSNKYNFLFGGDMENRSYPFVVNMPDYLHLLKVPHHMGSSTSKFLEKFNLKDKIDVACTTQYNSSNPDRGLLKNYIESVKKVVSTSSLDFEKKSQKNHSSVNSLQHEDYGILHYSFDILTKNFNLEVYGDAIELDENS